KEHPVDVRLAHHLIAYEQVMRQSYIDWVLLPQKLQEISSRPGFLAYLERIAWGMQPPSTGVSFDVTREEHALRRATLDRIWRGDVRAELRVLNIAIRKKELDAQTAEIKKTLIDLRHDVNDLETWEKEVWLHPEPSDQPRENYI